jgi:formate hydrogenlyase transcriptional activator
MSRAGGQTVSSHASGVGQPGAAGPLAARHAALTGILNALGTSQFIHDQFRSVAIELRPIARFNLLTLQLYDEASQSFHRYTTDLTRGPGFALPPDIRTAETGAWWVYERQQPLAIPHVDRETRFRRVIGALQGYGLQSVYLFPLTTVHRRLGSIAFTSDHQQVLSEEVIRFLSTISFPIAMSVENAIRHGRLPELEDSQAPPILADDGDSRHWNEPGGEPIVGNSAPLRKVLEQVRRVAPTSATVMIYGETGAGKDLIARAIHNLSPRRSHPFVNLNCAAIPAGLLESELFGHERGAFTGAVSQRIGRFELASQGSVFLDEIGEIPLDMQPKLLRVLQERQFERLGSGRVRRTDARLIAATNGDLSQRVAQQTFRADLYFRLNVFPIHVPALRERREDIPLLVDYFVELYSLRTGKKIETISAETMSALVEYDWPGNIRELQNVIERAVILSSGKVLMVPAEELPAGLRARFVSGQTAPPRAENMRSMLETVERERILKALEQANWIVSGPNGAAVRLGMNRSTLQFRMGKLGIPSRRP